jgi:hypothetical protein
LQLERLGHGHVEPSGGDRFKPSPEVVSAPILQHPIYGCADTVVVTGFSPGAELQIFIQGKTAPVGIDHAAVDPSGQVVKVSGALTIGQQVYAIAVKGGVSSKPSNTVVVTDYKLDYRNGLPQPEISPAPCLNCGAAVGVTSVIPGSHWIVYAENPTGGGGFGPKTQIASGDGYSYAFVSPKLSTGQRITVQASMCTDKSQFSAPPQIVQMDPTNIPAPTVDPFYQGATTLVVRAPGSTGLLDGAAVNVFGSFGTPPTDQIGGQPTPGGAQGVGINPVAPAGSPAAKAWANQALCNTGPNGPKQTELPCSSLPPAKIRTPLPGDTSVSVIAFVPGSSITIFAVNGGTTTQIGAGGGPQITLTQPVANGDTIYVLQSLGDCLAKDVFVIAAGCGDIDPSVCSGDWPAFRHSAWRDGQQPLPSVLTNPDEVRKLAQVWTFTVPSEDGVQAFRASPIVFQGVVYIGNGNGHLYALDADHGTLLWEYPAKGAPGLLSAYSQANGGENASSHGIAASATIAMNEGNRPMVVFGAPDPSLGMKMGSGRLFALNLTSGAEIWKSPEIAVVTG